MGIVFFGVSFPYCEPVVFHLVFIVSLFFSRFKKICRTVSFLFLTFKLRLLLTAGKVLIFGKLVGLRVPGDGVMLSVSGRKP